MTSKNKEIPDFFSNEKVFGFNMGEVGYSPRMENYDNNKVFSNNNQMNTQQLQSINNGGSKDLIAGFIPNFILNDISKENEEEAFNKNSTNIGMNGQNFFFDDYDDDSENEDNQRLIINTINNLDNFDDSNNFDNNIFNSTQNQEVKFF